MAKKLEINKSWCKGCGICAAFCPKNVLTIVGGKAEIGDENECLRCGICENLCPDFAVYLIEEEVVNHG